MKNTMKKTYLALALGSVMFAQVNAGGVPTFDSVDVALEMRNLAEQLVRNYTQYEQYTKQLEQYKNQFGETSDLLDKLQNLEFVDSSYGYVPANPKEAIEVLTGVSKHMPENIKQENKALLKNLNELNISSKDIKKALEHSAKELSIDYDISTKQMNAAQERIRSAKGLKDLVQNAESQKEREAAIAHIGVENIKATSEIANILATQKSRENIKAIEKEIKRQYYKKGVDEFVNAGREK